MSLQEPTTEQVLEERSNIGDKVDINSALGGVVYKVRLIGSTLNLTTHTRRLSNVHILEIKKQEALSA